MSNGGCSPYATCTNTPGSFTCQCLPGFSQVGIAYIPFDGKEIKLTCCCQVGSGLGSSGCSDINECSINNGNCTQVCNNTIGSFVCSCLLGYQVCVCYNHCPDLVVISSYWFLQGNGIGSSGCLAINRCTTTNPTLQAQCSPNATCTSLTGSYTCQCNQGFAGDGLNCSDINGQYPSECL